MNHSIPERKDTDPRFHWHIEDYFKTDADWEAAYSALEASIPEMAAFSGKLAESAETLLSCLQKNETLSLKLDHVYTYANMRMHEDSANAFYQGMASRAEMLLIRY
ncbi:MAG: oligoendopeptidase F, partial [Anaerotignum sp.]|nr:oligoendopeptidase F [Anaerotignum sp.]